MSQAGIVDFEGSHPQVPTTFVTNMGTATPIANTLEILGTAVAAHSIPLQTTGSGNTVTIQVQYASAAPTSVASNAGIASFNSADFTVDANGYVTLNGSGVMESFEVDAFTPPGTNPVLPNGSGMVTITGGQVAAGTTANVIRTNSLAANTYTIQIQRSQAVASSTIGDNGVSHFNSTYFTVDGNGFVSINGSHVGETITGSIGGALSPTAGNWNILGSSTAAGTTPVQTSGSVSTLTIQVQKSQAIASTDATKVGLAVFDSAHFSVDANGFVSLSGTGDLVSLNGDTGSATPTAGAINVYGNTSPATTGLTFTGSASTLSLGGILNPTHGGTGADNSGSALGQSLVSDGTNFLKSLAFGSTATAAISHTISSSGTFSVVGSGGTINIGADAAANKYHIGSSSASNSDMSVGDFTLSLNAGSAGGGAILLTAGVGGTGGTIELYTNSLGGVGINSSPINGGSTNIGSSTSSSTSIGCSSSSSISLNPNGGTVNIGNTGVNTIVIGNASNANISITSNTSVTIANGSSAGFIIVNGSGGTIAIGTDNQPNTLTLGTTNTTSTTLIQAGSGGITLSGRTAYMPIVGGTTTTAPIQSVSTSGAMAGYVLTYVSSSAIPTWQAAASSGITTLNGNSGSATGSTVTISGGTTGLTTSGSSATITLGGTLGIANGGTNATSFTQSNGIVTYNGTSLVNYAGPQLSSGGIYTNTSQPIFSVYLATTVTNVTGDSTNYTVLFDTKLKDQGTHYATGTGLYTVPTTGTYQFNLQVAFTSIGAAAGVQMKLVTTGNTFISSSPVTLETSNTVFVQASWIAPMTAADTASVVAKADGTTKSLGISGTIGGFFASTFSGFLIG